MRALRTLSRQWQLAAVATFSLAIAMALGMIGLSAANTMLLLPLAAPDPGRLVAIYSRAADNGVDQISYPDLEYYRANNHVFTGIAASPNSISLSIDRSNDGREIRIIGRPVSANYFDVLGIRPLRGRFFNAVDDRVNSHVAVMTYACWRRLGFDPNIVGKSVAGNTIVGVTPPSFTGSLYGLNGDLLYPLAQLDDPASFEKRDARRFFLIGRLKPGVSRRQAQAEITMLARQLAEAYPHADKGRTAVLTRASLLPPDAVAGAQWVSAIVMALILLVLLIACANVANLLLAAAVGRRQEAAIKLALGAPRGRLIRDFLQESGLLCAAGGLFGVRGRERRRRPVQRIHLRLSDVRPVLGRPQSPPRRDRRGPHRWTRPARDRRDRSRARALRLVAAPRPDPRRRDRRRRRRQEPLAQGTCRRAGRGLHARPHRHGALPAQSLQPAPRRSRLHRPKPRWPYRLPAGRRLQRGARQGLLRDAPPRGRRHPRRRIRRPRLRYAAAGRQRDARPAARIRRDDLDRAHHRRSRILRDTADATACRPQLHPLGSRGRPRRRHRQSQNGGHVLARRRPHRQGGSRGRAAAALHRRRGRRRRQVRRVSTRRHDPSSTCLSRRTTRRAST